MSELFGSRRPLIQNRFAVLNPQSVVPTALSGWQKAVCQVMISPALGAQFSQLFVTLSADGQCAGNTGASEYFFYVLEGPASVLLDDRRHRLDAGSYVFVPPGKDVQFSGAGPATRVAVWQKPYRSLPGVPKPAALVQHERDVKSAPWVGNDLVRCQSLLPDQPAFDLAVDLLTFPPGAASAKVTTQVGEQGVLLLGGQGLFRLSEEWCPVQTHDALWVGPYCPYWFAAIGKGPATLLGQREVNRDPM